MFFQKLVIDFFKENKFKTFGYILLVLIIYPLETIVLARLSANLFINVNNQAKLLKFIIYILICWIIITSGYYFKNLIECIITPKYLSFIRQLLFKNTINLYENDYEELRIGKFLPRIIELSRYLKDLLYMTIDNIIPDVLIVFMITIYFIFSLHKISWILISNIVIITLILLTIGKRCLNAAISKYDIYYDMIDKIFDSFSNLANIYINNQNDNQIKSNSETENGYAKLHSSTSLKINNMNALITFIAIMFYIGAVYILYKSKINKSISNIEFITYFIVLSYYIKSTLKLISVINPYITKLAIIKYSEKFIENILSASDDNNKNNSNINNGSIQFNNISFGYKKSNKQIYSRFNLEIKGGEKVALIGSSGSGKSTLMKLLLKLHKLDGGEIYIDNKNIDYMSAKYIRDNCIYINQKTQLFNESVLYNIKYGNDSVDDNYIKSIMQNYEIDVLFKNLEKGLDSICGPNGSNLSLGMQKVIIIMRGILKDNGKIYIFDEPLAGLDINTRKKIIKLIINKTKHKTLVVITHDTDIIPYLDRTINLNKEMKST